MSKPIPYRLVRSSRKTLSLEITQDCTVLVRAPSRLARAKIDEFVAAHADWIDAHLQAQRERALRNPEPTAEEAQALVDRARDILPARVAHYAHRMHVVPTGLKITGARKRYGSCNSRNSLCFSYLLMRYPDAAIDYVVVHELAHIVHKNHGPDFHALVESILPDWRARRALLRD